MMSLRHGWSWYPPQTTSYIHIMHIQSVWAIVMLSQGHVGAPLYHYPGQVGPIFGKSGSLQECKWCHNIIVEADIHLWLLHTSILDIYKGFEPLVCCLKRVWVHPYTVTPAKPAPDLGSHGPFIVSLLIVIFAGDCDIFPSLPLPPSVSSEQPLLLPVDIFLPLALNKQLTLWSVSPLSPRFTVVQPTATMRTSRKKPQTLPAN